MPFRSRRRGPPLIVDKHEVPFTHLVADASTTLNDILATVVQPSAKNLGTEVGVGSRVNGVYVEFNIAAENITSPKIVHWQVILTRAGQTIGAASTYYNAERSQILKRGMEMLPKDVGTVYKRIIFAPLPKGSTRMRENSEIILRFQSSSTETVNICGFAIYKELT